MGLEGWWQGGGGELKRACESVFVRRAFCFQAVDTEGTTSHMHTHTHTTTTHRIDTQSTGFPEPVVVLLRGASGDEEVGAAGANLQGVVLTQDLPHLSHLGECGELVSGGGGRRVGRVRGSGGVVLTQGLPHLSHFICQPTPNPDYPTTGFKYQRIA
jgi:hypothetical protein